jgi:hypothetical protein
MQAIASPLPQLCALLRCGLAPTLSLIIGIFLGIVFVSHDRHPVLIESQDLAVRVASQHAAVLIILAVLLAACNGDGEIGGRGRMSAGAWVTPTARA